MRLYFILSILLVFTNCSNNESPISQTENINITFIKTLGGNKNEIANSVVKTNDGGYAICGYTDSNNEDFDSKVTNDSDFFLLKYSSNDTLEWSKIYGGSDNDRAHSVIQTSDTGFAIIGFSKSNDGDATENKGNNDFWMLKLTANGEISWQKSYGFSGNDTGYAVIQTADNGFLLIGELDVTSSGGEGNSKSLLSRHAGGDYWAIKLNATGEKEWSKFYGGTFTDTPTDIIETSSGDFLIAGTTDSTDVDISNPKGDYDFWVVKIDNTGTLLWEKNFGGSQADKASRMVKTNDNQFIIIGNTRSNDKDISFNNGGGDLWLVKIDADGKMIWEKTYGGSSFETGSSIFSSSNGDFLIVGNSRSLDNNFSNKGQNDAWIQKISSEGTIKWQKFIGGSNVDVLYDVTEINDGSIIAVGESTSNDKDITENKGFSDILITKLN
ncbi:hypothetical protein [Tenacibaculum agarivorans]|uniref:hypothetical protein n=1 Tax=Tenacibaculum agarivorans TaxID=1908389 RepID=UPI00094B9F89|nr:hypothetical protein [Tenacibaculum agarivorans]